MENNYPIPRNILDAFDVASLMGKMAAADWYYDYTEDPHVWEKGRSQVNKIKDDLLQLSKMENGLMAANYLWDAYVPVYSVNKPDFLIKKNLSTCKINVMNYDNLEYLKKNLFYSGFGESMNNDLEKNIRGKASEFVLTHVSEFNNGIMEYNLRFKKGNENEMYFFNSYDAKLTKHNGNEVQQTFYMDKGKGFTMKEAYNLLNGRAVYKQLENASREKYFAWKVLDFGKKHDNGNYEFQTYHTNYGFDLEKALEKYPIKELKDAGERENLISSLQRGNLQAVTFEEKGATERMFITANPQYKNLDVYDKQMKMVTVEVRNSRQMNGNVVKDAHEAKTIEGPKQKRENTVNEKLKAAERSADEDLLPKTGKKKAEKKAKSNKDDSLLPKKRANTGKGIGL